MFNFSNVVKSVIILFALFSHNNLSICAELHTPPQTPKVQAEQQANSPLKTEKKANQIRKTTTNPLIIVPANQSNELATKTNNNRQKSTNVGTEFYVFFGYKFRITDMHWFCSLFFFLFVLAFWH